MGKRVVLAVFVVALVFAVGLGARTLLFPEEPEADTAQVPSSDPELPDATPLEQAPELEREAVLTNVQGHVVREQNGERVEVREGDYLPLDSMLETEEGSATIQLAGEAGMFEVDARTALTLTPEEEGVAGVRLDRGRTVASSSGNVRVTFAGSDAVAETTDGEIAAVTDGEGRVSVASQRGRVRLTANDESVELDEGEESGVLPEGAPSEPRVVPESFFLRVRRPPATTRVAAATIQGNATPGTIVTVDDAPVAVDASGRFQTRVRLRQGNNQVTVRGRDASGRSQTRMHRVVVDSTASEISSDVTWD